MLRLLQGGCRLVTLRDAEATSSLFTQPGPEAANRGLQACLVPGRRGGRRELGADGVLVICLARGPDPPSSGRGGARLSLDPPPSPQNPCVGHRPGLSPARLDSEPQGVRWGLWP